MSKEAKYVKLHRCLHSAELRALTLRFLKYSCEIQADFNVKKKPQYFLSHRDFVRCL